MRYIAKFPACCLLLFCGIVFAGSGNTNNTFATGPEVTDDLGRLVRLDRPARRIVALSPHIVENLYSAGLGSAIVAAVEYADYPESAKALPRVGGFANFGVEAILRFKPDLVVGWVSGYSDFNRLVTQLDSLGIAVYADEPRQLEDIARSINNLAILGDSVSIAQVETDRFESRLNNLRNRYRETTVRPESVRTFYPIWPEPLQTLNGQHIVSDVIKLCGGINVFQAAPVLAPRISIEAVLAADPELIVASSSSGEPPTWLNQFSDWRRMTAVKNRQLYYIDGDLLSRHTVRMLDGADLMCNYIDRARQLREQ